MDKKFYVSYEAARLLKDKGYDRECVAYYQHERFHPYSVDLFKLSINDKNAAPSYMEQYSAPTKAEAIDWLESKGIVVEVPFVRNKKWRFSLYKGDCFYMDSWIHDRLDFPTRLEAEEAAIIKALKLL